MKFSNRLVVMLGAVLAIVLVGGAMWAFAQSSEVAACIKGGDVKQLGFAENVSCKDGEELITWSIMGPQGPPGPPGPPGEGVLEFYQRKTVFTCPSSECIFPDVSIIASCDPGDVATGGSGFRVILGPSNSPLQDIPHSPYPNDTSAAPTGWALPQVIFNGGNRYEVTAICADMTP